MMTTIKSELINSNAELVTAKICIFENEGGNSELYLCEIDLENEVPEEEDHLIIQKTKEGITYINGKPVNKRIVDEIINFLK